MKKINYLILVLFTAVFFNCSDNTLEELSIDPNNPSEVSPTLLLTSIQTDIIGNFGYNWDRYSGVFIQTFAGNHATGVNADQYNLQASDFQTAFTGRYVGGFKDAFDLINTEGPKAEAWHHVGVAKILLATGLGYLTDVYGDIPYTEAFRLNEGLLNPKYDAQSVIYDSINTLLTEAIIDLDKTVILPLAGDLMHANNVAKWKATAYLLLARYANHQSKIDPIGSATKTLEYVDMAKAAGLVDNSWNYSMKYDPMDANWRNPWFELYQNNLIIASSNFMGILLSPGYGSWDPRLFSYWDTVSVDETFVDFSGKDNGLPTGSASFSPVGPNGFYGKQDSDDLIATHFELLFIEAEAALRSNNPERAATALNEALTSQINLVSNAGVDHAATYFDTDTATAQSYIDLRVDAYINANSLSAANISMEHIMTEKYKAMFCINTESWVDVRRHDYQYPNYLALPANAVQNDFVRRGLYPQSEIQNNTSTPTGVTMLDKLWWDQ